MTVKLKLETGEIKEYKTLCMDYWGEGYTEYKSECGIRWNSNSSEPRPSLDEGCDHLNCAIYASKYDNNKLKIISVITIVIFSSIFFLMGDGDSAYAVLIGIFGFSLSLLENRDTKELNEFKTQGTVNGIRAHQIFETVVKNVEIKSLREKLGRLKFLWIHK